MNMERQWFQRRLCAGLFGARTAAPWRCASFRLPGCAQLVSFPRGPAFRLPRMWRAKLQDRPGEQFQTQEECLRAVLPLAMAGWDAAAGQSIQGILPLPEHLLPSGRETLCALL